MPTMPMGSGARSDQQCQRRTVSEIGSACAIRGVLGHQSPTPPLLLWCDPDRSWLELLREASKADGFELWVPPAGQEDLARVAGARSVLFVAPRLRESSGCRARAMRSVGSSLSSWRRKRSGRRACSQALREYGVDISRDHEDELGRLAAGACPRVVRQAQGYLERTYAGQRQGDAGRRSPDVAGTGGTARRIRPPA